ncbi:RagB/SusD family nutrient uptake outer membrane protein [Chitinophaga sp. Cy-1792]|uniref:RagB/SusD family nutrient uptake outer membrane protein n=1 Tax=Chitinophaga sp. Cy-1792 TaxID=2608339 RepID=UPI00142206D8|nr:RagB/SusD family nutrient uptake outer membrane protein [Chitinophaga sp. Cy-1792]NIG56831.1 RagB/SusD family nutrient uptake outer membrane protein [Chitinophaga sp. Cy-1792]
MNKLTGILLLSATLMASCSKDFIDRNNPNATTTDNFFTSENSVLLAVNGAYSSLRGSNNIGENSGLYTDERSDDTGTNDNQSNAGEPFQFGNFKILPSNTYLKAHWGSLYATITQCNAVTSNIDKVTFASNDTKLQYLAEAKFIRALIYFHLVRKWGDVPLVTTVLKSTDEIAANTYRQPQAKVYAQIIADLKDALQSNLPNLQSGAGVGRASKAAINGLLGQVYLTMASNFDDNKADNLNNANTYLTAAYNMRPFGKLSEIPYEDVFDVSKKVGNKEMIFQIVYKQGDITYGSSIAANNQALGETINSQKKALGVGGNVTADLILDYEPNDLRKTFSVKYAANTQVQDWFVTKYRDASDAAGVNGYGGNDEPLMRYADIILMLAEVNMLQGNNAAAIQFLDQVRERAKMPLYATAVQDPNYTAKYPSLKLAILHERRVELAFEHQRWFDLLRFFTTDELVTFFKGKSQANFGNAQLSNFSKKDRYFPIPFDEYKLNPDKMYQNPGYE